VFTIVWKQRSRSVEYALRDPRSIIQARNVVFNMLGGACRYDRARQSWAKAVFGGPRRDQSNGLLEAAASAANCVSYRAHSNTSSEHMVTLSGICGRREMPWKELSKMDERMRFVARLMEGEKMECCAESSISRARPATSSLIGTKTQGLKA